jgi:arginyl-tRNA synthetase
MKHIVINLVNQALQTLPELAEAAADLSLESTVERTRDASHGDFASNIAMRLAKPARKNPKEIATSIVEAFSDNAQIVKVEIAGPGFINFHLSPSAFHSELEAILDSGTEYGRQAKKDAPKILLEFISANPTGPLHVGHGRHAAYGASVGNLLEAAGFPVHREYYVNDAGRQMDILGTSVWLRWLEWMALALAWAWALACALAVALAFALALALVLALALALAPSALALCTHWHWQEHLHLHW